MAQKETSLTDMQGYIERLKYRLALYQSDGVAAPTSFLIEFKMAEHLAMLDATDASHIDVKA